MKSFVIFILCFVSLLLNIEAQNKTEKKKNQTEDVSEEDAENITTTEVPSLPDETEVPQKRFRQPGFDHYCHCDLTVNKISLYIIIILNKTHFQSNFCNINCCCDQDCSESDKEAFADCILSRADKYLGKS